MGGVESGMLNALHLEFQLPPGKIKIEKQSRSLVAESVVKLTEEARNIVTTNKYAQMIQQEI